MRAGCALMWLVHLRYEAVLWRYNPSWVTFQDSCVTATF